MAEDLNSRQPRTNPANGQSGTRTQGLPDFESDADHSATVPSLKSLMDASSIYFQSGDIQGVIHQENFHKSLSETEICNGLVNL